MSGTRPITEQFPGLTYPEYLNDHTLDKNLPACEFKLSTDQLPPSASAGVLQTLPLELIQIVLGLLDLNSISRVQQVNRRTSELVSSLPHYRALVQHAQNALRGISAIGTGSSITLAKLYEKICTAECEDCGDFGGYLYLITCKRVCFLCFSKKEAYMPLSPVQACRKFGISHKMLSGVPRMVTRAGTYSFDGKKVKDGLTLIDHRSAREMGIRFHGSLRAMIEYASVRDTQKYHKYLRTVEEDRIYRRTGQCRRRAPISDPFDAQSRNPLRFVSIVRVPWLNRISRDVEWGVHCEACRECLKLDQRSTHCRRKFTAGAFLEHLEQHEDISYVS
ncbi:hypothetical protein BKA56DRAFT_618867 [Ilyonectria sp. MPI-CAGE-AT-0026]|nr:hypothetical protein BKA56DRAFT_618867 [Ilyonectria sp. MPI-CAGE-AT-0026]